MQEERDDFLTEEEDDDYQGNDPGDENDNQQEPARPTLGYSEEQVNQLIEARLIAEREKIISEERNRAANASKPPATTEDPYDRAIREAGLVGKEYDAEYVTRLATKYVREESDQKIAAARDEILNGIGSHFGPILQERVAREVVGNDPVAQDYAVKLMRKGLDISDPDIKDVIQRASQSVASEKSKGKGDYERYNPQAPKYTSAQAAEINEIEAIIKSVNPKASIKN